MGSAYERSFFTIPHVTTLRPLKDLEFSIGHVFQGDLRDKPIRNIFGLRQGALVNLKLRWVPYKTAAVITEVLTREREYLVGATYTFLFSSLSTSVTPSAHYATFADDPFEISGDEQRKHLMIVSLTAQQSLLAHHLDLGIHATWNSNRNMLGGGCALFYQPIRFLRLTAEIYPGFHHDLIDNATLLGGAYLITHGHQFHFFISNNTDLSLRKLPFLSGGDDGLYIGFIIKRKLHLDRIAKRNKEDYHAR
ncbi:MAG: hypothetical protein GF401_04960 [Chitinivibrionales bacterium]|nr:hypothetical protein [Chitinivibrionales bacterium]